MIRNALHNTGNITGHSSPQRPALDILYTSTVTILCEADPDTEQFESMSSDFTLVSYVCLATVCLTYDPETKIFLNAFFSPQCSTPRNTK
jgi:hypothetical protein